jgi:hypothetical protein
VTAAISTPEAPAAPPERADETGSRHGFSVVNHSVGFGATDHSQGG